MLLGPEAFGGTAGPGETSLYDPSLDSHVRFLSGVFLALGLVFLSCVPAIQHKTHRFRLAAGAVVLGGLARAWSVAAVGPPDWPHLAGLAMELGVVPLLVLWQARIARPAR